MKTLEIRQMESLQGGDSCLSAFMASASAFYSYASSPNIWTWGFYAYSLGAVAQYC